MFRAIGYAVAAAAVNTGMIGYAGFFRQNKVVDVYNNLDEKTKEEIYNKCPVQQRGSSYDGIAALNERMITLDPDSRKNDKPLKPFK
jgi:hypothetical protein